MTPLCDLSSSQGTAGPAYPNPVELLRSHALVPHSSFITVIAMLVSTNKDFFISCLQTYLPRKHLLNDQIEIANDQNKNRRESSMEGGELEVEGGGWRVEGGGGEIVSQLLPYGVVEGKGPGFCQSVPGCGWCRTATLSHCVIDWSYLPSERWRTR